MCCSCSTCACCTVFLASLLLATIFTAGYWVVKNHQIEKFVSRDFRKKFFSMFNFLGTYARIYIKRSMQRDRERMKMHQNYGLNGNRPPVRVRPQNQWYANG